MAQQSERAHVKLTISGHFITGLCALLFLVAAGLFIVLLLRPLYYFDISYLGIVENSGYNRSEILLNYNALINWCMPWVTSEFALPTFASSPKAIIHFEEVKRIFNVVFVTGIFSGILLFILSYRAIKNKNRQRFIVAGSVTLALPTFLGIYAALDFNRAFVFFHELVFRNELWIFDYKTDPVITILPEAYFMHCTFVILFILAIGAAGLFLLGRRMDL